MRHSMKIFLKTHIVMGLCTGLLFSAFFPLLTFAEVIEKGKYTINLSSEQKKKGNYQILEISGDITGPKCGLMRLNVYFQNEYGNRAHKIFLLEDIKDNVSFSFADFDEVFPTKNKTTWRVNEVYAECKD